MRFFTGLLIASFLAAAVSIPLVFADDEKPPAPKAVMPFAELLPADSTFAAVAVRDIDKLLSDLDELFARVPSLDIQEDVKDDFIELFSEARTTFESPFVGEGCAERFRSSSVMHGTWACVWMLPPRPDKSDNESEVEKPPSEDNDEDFGPDEDMEPSSPVRIDFFKPKDFEKMKKLVDLRLKNLSGQKASQGRRVWRITPDGKGEWTTEEPEKGTLEVINHNGVEIRIATSGMSRFARAVMVINDTIVSARPGYGTKREDTLAVLKKIADASQGKIPSLAKDDIFSTSAGKMDPKDNFLVWCRPDLILTMIRNELVIFGGREKPPKIKNLIGFIGGGFHGEGDTFTGSFRLGYSNDDLKGAFGNNAWTAAKYVPEEGLWGCLAVDIDLTRFAKVTIKTFSEMLPSDIWDNLDKMLETATKVTGRNAKKELPELLGRKGFIALVGFGTYEPLLLFGVETKGPEFLKLISEGIAREYPDQPIVKTENYKGHEIIIFGANLHCIQEGDMLLIATRKETIQQVIDCLRGRGVTFGQNEMIGRRLKGSSIAAFFSGQILRRAMMKAREDASMSEHEESLILEIFRDATLAVKEDESGLTGRACLKLGPKAKFTEEQILTHKFGETEEYDVVDRLHRLPEMQKRYRSIYGKYGTQEELLKACEDRKQHFNYEKYFVEAEKGYKINIRVEGDKKWSAVVVPEKYKETGWRSFYIDQSGVIRFTKDGSTPTAESPELVEIDPRTGMRRSGRPRKIKRRAAASAAEMLEAAKAFENLEEFEYEEQIRRYQRVIDKYPGTPQAREAAERIKIVKKREAREW